MADTPRRLQCQRTKAWAKRKPPGTIYVGRPSRWGNPFQPRGKTIEAHQEAVDEYRDWLMEPERAFFREDIRRELRGHDLSCWCRINWPCHADVLLEVANN
jgi:hypothetical protein